MDVRCERCQTEYDFDDALVSDRGTTVKCTNCGHQFKVYPVAGAGRPEIWVVRPASGVEVTYTALRDLQRAIAQGQVSPDDLLLPKGLPPRPLRSIAELQPFFGAHRPAGGTQRTLAGVSPPVAGAEPHEPVAPSPVGAARQEPFAPSRSDRPPRPDARSGRQRTTTAPKLPPFDAKPARSTRRDSERPTVARQEAEPKPAAAAAAAPEAPRRSKPAPAAPAPELAPARGTTTLGLAPAGLAAPGAGDSSPTAASPPAPDAGEPAPHAAPDAGEPAVADPAGAVAAVRTSPPDPVSPSALPEVEPTPPERAEAAVPAAYRPEEYFTPPPRELSFSGSLSEPDPRFVPPSRARRVRAGWIVGIVLVGGLLLIAATIGVSLVRRLAAPAPGTVAAPAPSSDPKVEAYLAEGRRLLAAADVDGAGAAVTKASALAESDPAVLAALAEVETVRADFVWLRLRLLDPTSTERVDATARELGQRVGRARTAVDAAAAAPVPDPTARRLRVDLLRLDGQVAEARALVVPLAERVSEPETAYVLGALDLAEATPAFRSAAARLRVAAAAEGRLGRARAALIYALARAGDLDAARRELGLLTAATAAHPLAADLARFVDRCDVATEPGDAAVEVVDTEGLRTATATGVGPVPGGVIDFRERLQQASAALGGRDLDRAERLYRSVLAEQPNNTEALAGVAEVARQRNDPRAGALYDAVLAQNPSYVPAIVARADQKWAAGDVAGAIPLYQRVVAQAGANSSYGRHASARLAEGARRAGAADAGPPAPTAAAPPPTAARPASTTAPPPATAAPPAADAPYIDTTDLPEF